jgi:RNA polymerase sigma-70 factor (ECF subfamily)
MRSAEGIPELLLFQVRAGDEAALGRLLELYRNYLRLLARSLISQPLRVRLDASDLVQEAFLKAHREFSQFLGASEPELVAWLRRILVRTLADQVKRHRAKGRDYRREEPLEVMLDRSSLAIQQALAVPVSSPSSRVSRREQAVLLANALEKLPEAYRDVFILRNLEHIPFDTSFRAKSREGGWGRFSRAATSTWGGTWPSRYCSSRTREISTSCADSWKRRRSAGSCSTRASCRSMNWGRFRITGRISR